MLASVPRLRGGLSLVGTFALAPLVVGGCQAGMSAAPPVAPVPPLVLGLPVFLTPEPSILKVEDPAGRPLAMALVHDVRDVLEEAGFKLAPTPEAASGIVATVVIQRIGAIHADLFIHGAQACGVRLDVMRADARLASAEPEVPCVSTSSYYGALSKDAAVGLVNTVSRAPTLIAVAETLHPPPPGPPPSKTPREPDPQPELPR
jgi:hypothetical protein